MATTTLRSTAGVSPAERSRVKAEVRDVFRKYDASRDGYIDQKELAALLTDLRGSRPTKNDVLFALRAMDLSDDGRVSFAEMCRYWEQYKVGHGGGKLNKLLVRDTVGTVRTSSYDLPPTTHAFGGKAPKVGDEIGTRQVLEDWQVSKSTATRTRRTKPTVAAATTRHRDTAASHGKANRPSTPIDGIIKGTYAGPAALAKDTTYPAKPRRVRKDVPVARTTHAAEARMRATKERAAEESGSGTAAPGTWKMKKFANVKARIVI